MQTPQQPLGSGFGPRSTAREVLAGIDLIGKTALVTGGYSGLGTETVRALAEAGATVIVGARRPDKAAGDLAGIAGEIVILSLDLSEPTSIDAFASEVAARTGALHILINNAAIMACPLARDARGYESQFATNHLGHFRLTARLWPLLKAAGGARVVSLSSIGHRRSEVDLDDPHFERRDYDKWAAYGQAKTANAQFATHLDALGEGHGVRAFSVHPGGIATPLQRSLTMDEMQAMGWYDAEGNLSDAFKTTEQGAATSVWAATSPMLMGKGGAYCEDCDIAAAFDPAGAPWAGVKDYAVDPQKAAALWAASEQMNGVNYGG